MKDYGEHGDTKRSANIPEHVSQRYNGTDFLGHQLYAGVIGRRENDASADAVEEKQ